MAEGGDPVDRDFGNLSQNVECTGQSPRPHTDCSPTVRIPLRAECGRIVEDALNTVRSCSVVVALQLGVVECRDPVSAFQHSLYRPARRIRAVIPLEVEPEK